MPDLDLNKMLVDVQKKSMDIKRELLELLGAYEDFYRFSNRSYLQERSAATSTEGFEDFYRMVQSVRRNRDVVGSMVRGIMNLRPLAEFKVIEEDVPEPLSQKKQAKQEEKSPEIVTPPEQVLEPTGDTNA